MSKRKIQVAVVNNQKLFRDGINRLLEKDDSVQIALESNHIDELQLSLEEYIPDLLITELGKAPLDTLNKIKEIVQLYPSIKILILTEIKSKSIVLQSLRSGIDGYLLKETNFQTIKEVVLHIFNGGSYLDPKITKYLMENYRVLDSLYEQGALSAKAVQVPNHILTKRECEILQLLSDGNTNIQIANKLLISDKTIKNHMSKILMKLEVPHRTAAVITAIRNHWVYIR